MTSEPLTPEEEAALRRANDRRGYMNAPEVRRLLATLDAARQERDEAQMEYADLLAVRAALPRERAETGLRKRIEAVVKDVGCVRMHWGARRPCDEYEDGRELCAVCALRLDLALAAQGSPNPRLTTQDLATPADRQEDSDAG